MPMTDELRNIIKAKDDRVQLAKREAAVHTEWCSAKLVDAFVRHLKSHNYLHSSVDLKNLHPCFNDKIADDHLLILKFERRVRDRLGDVEITPNWYDPGEIKYWIKRE